MINWFKRLFTPRPYPGYKHPSLLRELGESYKFKDAIEGYAAANFPPVTCDNFQIEPSRKLIRQYGLMGVSHGERLLWALAEKYAKGELVPKQPDVVVRVEEIDSATRAKVV